MSMLYYFLSSEHAKESKEWFKGLKIAKARSNEGKDIMEEYRGKYPVIKLDFKDIEARSHEEFIRSLGSKMYQQYLSFSELRGLKELKGELEKSEDQLEKSEDQLKELKVELEKLEGSIKRLKRKAI